MDVGLAQEDGGSHSVYAAAMVAAEHELWSQAQEAEPRFRINIVSHSNLVGQNFASEYTLDWQNWIWELYLYGHVHDPTGLGPLQRSKLPFSLASRTSPYSQDAAPTLTGAC